MKQEDPLFDAVTLSGALQRVDRVGLLFVDQLVRDSAETGTAFVPNLARLLRIGGLLVLGV